MLNSELSIALCTRNGAAYLPRQLESLTRQTLTPGELVACDDASSDSSPTLIATCLQNAPFPVKISRNPQPLGAAANFSRAISLCTGRYIALCDQDDIWLPAKLELTMQLMKEAEKKYGAAKPLLVHTDLTLINSAEKIIAPSLFRLRKIKPYYRDPLKVLLFQNFVTGCTVLMNRPLVEAALPVPETALMHDWWLALMAAARGHILVEPRSTVHYRRHDGNVFDLHPFYSTHNLKKMFATDHFSASIAAMVNQALALQQKLSLLQSPEKPPYLDRFLSAACRSGPQAALLALRYGIGKVGPGRNTAFIFHLFKGDYRQTVN